MARQLRIRGAGLTYHVMARGNARQSIFLDDRDYSRFFEIFSETAESHGISCHSYCGMPNHYHAVFATTRDNLSEALRRLNSVYARWWNHRHQRVGHVLQGRFRAQVVQDSAYLLTVCRYVSLNPVRAGLVRAPEDWPWSSYNAIVTGCREPSFLQTGALLGLFNEQTDVARERFRDYVRSGLESPLERPPSGPVIGDPDFLQQIHESIPAVLPEVPHRVRGFARPSLEAIFDGVLRRYERRSAIGEAYLVHGYTMTEIADFLGVHYSTVSRTINGKKSGAG